MEKEIFLFLPQKKIVFLTSLKIWLGDISLTNVSSLGTFRNFAKIQTRWKVVCPWQG